MSNSIFRKDGTAQGVAKQRYIETIADPAKRVIDDPYSSIFTLGAGLIKLMGHGLNLWLTNKLAPGFHEHLIARTRFIDDLVKESTENGIEQYVILGAGYDMRAHRLDLPASLKIFEVDQPAVQSKKISKLPKELSDLDNVSYVNVDFANQSVSESLIEAGFDQTKSSIFTLEGVTQYIAKDAFNSTLSEIAKLAHGTQAIFFLSYVDELLNQNPEACFGNGYPNPAKKASLIQNLSAKAADEPWISFYSPKEMENTLSRNGFSLKEDKVLKDVNVEYFSPVKRILSENQIFNLEHFVVAKTIDQ